MREGLQGGKGLALQTSHPRMRKQLHVCPADVVWVRVFVVLCHISCVHVITWPPRPPFQTPVDPGTTGL